jgi:hypothetical protein
VWLKHDGVHVTVPVAINKQTCTISTLLSPSTPPGLQFTTCSRSSVKIFTNGSDYSFTNASQHRLEGSRLFNDRSMIAW